MSLNRKVIHRRRDELDAMGVRICWARCRPWLRGSVTRELKRAEQQNRRNTRLTLQSYVNYGGRAEIMDAAQGTARLAKAGKLDPDRLSGDRFRHFLDEPGTSGVDLFLRSSDEQRASNFLLWQSTYAELIFLNRPWPGLDRRNLWGATEQHTTREYHFGTI